QILDEPVIEQPVVGEFQGAQRVRDTLNRVGLTVGEIVARVDVPRCAGARMGERTGARRVMLPEAMSILARSSLAAFGNSPARMRRKRSRFSSMLLLRK